MSECEKVVCRTPNPGKQPTRIPKWKYDLVSASILNVLKVKGREGVQFKELSDMVEADMGKKMASKIGSIGWHTTHVKLDMECKGIIQRVPSSSPQRLVLS